MLAPVRHKAKHFTRGAIGGDAMGLKRSTSGAKKILNDILEQQCVSVTNQLVERVPGDQRRSVKTRSPSTMASFVQEHRERVMSGVKPKSLQPPKSDKMRGVPIDEPMTARDIAAVTGVTVSWVIRLVKLGHMKAHEPKRKQRKVKHYTGVVPIELSAWQREVKDIISWSHKGHIAGLSADGKTVHILGGRRNNRARYIHYSEYRDQSETDLDLLASLLDVDRGTTLEEVQSPEPEPQQQLESADL